jgi:SAM-dependent methyltransferase
VRVVQVQDVGPGGSHEAGQLQRRPRGQVAGQGQAVEDVLLDDPHLPASALDLILMVDVYHEFSEPQKMLRRMHEALRPGGRLVLLEYRKEDPAIPIRLEHKMTVAGQNQKSKPRVIRSSADEIKRPAAHSDLHQALILISSHRATDTDVRILTRKNSLCPRVSMLRNVTQSPQSLSRNLQCTCYS